MQKLSDRKFGCVMLNFKFVHFAFLRFSLKLVIWLGNISYKILN